MHRIGFLLVLIAISKTMLAQHCPFDGSTVILIQVKNKAGKPVVSPAFTFTLIENPNALADSCTYAPGQLALPFAGIKDSWINRYEGLWVKRATERLKECNFNNKPGYMSVVLNQAQESCMVKNGNDFDFRERMFTIQVKQGNDIKQTILVPVDRKYALCTAAGKWSRIKPITIIIE